MDRLARVSSLLLGLLIIGCASSPPVPPTASPVGVDADRLDGRTYLSSSVIEDGTERSLVPGTLIRLSFAAGRLGAEAGCNSMGAPYEIVDGRLHIGEMATTLIGCPAPRGAGHLAVVLPPVVAFAAHGRR